DGKSDETLRKALTPLLDQTLSVLLADLEQRGLLETTLVLVMGEFGRTPTMNPQGGRDHWPDCWSLVMAGGGIKGGHVIGASDKKAAHLGDRLIFLGDGHPTLFKTVGL